MKLATFTDLHGTLPNLPQESVDAAIFAGDILPHNPNGLNVGNGSDFNYQVKYLFETVLPFFKSFNCPVVFIAGNHDLCLDKTKTGKLWHHKKFNVIDELNKNINNSNVHYLNRSEIVVNGVKFWGSPYVPFVANRWAFQYPEYCGLEFADNLYEQCPNNVDVLITHTPPAGILDNSGDKHYGCSSLAKFVSYKIKPKVHVFGHSHCRGINEEFNTKFVNAAICGHGLDSYSDEVGCPYHKQSLDPIVVEI